MLDNYTASTNAEQNRLEAVKAALEIIKASAPNNSVANVTEYTKQEVSNLADAIERAIDKK
ncbi:hypothetical protein ACIPT4_07895 [Pectobacterium jejuense]|uniref:hypothetical protein n=1 Tax=Pectobacterium jejuense TaxID=2974022 RepID=UPI0037F2AE9E